MYYRYTQFFGEEKYRVGKNDLLNFFFFEVLFKKSNYTDSNATQVRFVSQKRNYKKSFWFKKKILEKIFFKETNLAYIAYKSK